MYLETKGTLSIVYCCLNVNYKCIEGECQIPERCLVNNRGGAACSAHGSPLTSSAYVLPLTLTIRIKREDIFNRRFSGDRT